MANITPLPTPVPSTGDPENFDARADAFLGALPQFATEANQLAASLNNISTTSTSTTELTIGFGEKNLTVEPEKSYAIGQSVKIAVTADGTIWMVGEVTAYNVTSGELTIDVKAVSGSGTYSDWTTTLAFDAPLANLIAYDNTESELAATNVQAAIDEVQSNVDGITIASTAEAEAGTNNTNFITPLRMREGFNAGGAAPVYACRAWVNFNGTGTVAIRASGNVSSITDNGAGDYTVNFATAMASADFAVVCTGHEIQENFNGLSASLSGAYTMNVNNVRVVYVVGSSSGHFDTPIYSVAIFR